MRRNGGGGGAVSPGVGGELVEVGCGVAGNRMDARTDGASW